MRSSILILTFLGLGLVFSQPALAQNKAGIGVFANYFRFSDGQTQNFWGLGARGSFGVGSHAQLEAEAAYDFERVFAETFEGSAPGSAVFFERIPVRLLHLLFGPKFHTDAERPFIWFFTLKGGFVHFRFDDPPATLGSFFGTFDDLREENTRGVVYPAGGVEGYFGPFGFRLEIGDEIFFFEGAHNNLRVTFGPTFRF